MPAQTVQQHESESESESEDFTIGVEEEYQIVDAATRALHSGAARVLTGARQALGDEVTNELYLSQIEIATPVCHSLAEARDQLVRSRRGVIEAARGNGNRIVAAGTHPFSHWQEQQTTPKKRYRDLQREYQQLTQELVICGCHVHVGIGDPELAIGTMNRARLWLAPILALAANSPFWLGEDTGFASYRTELWSRFPLSGPPHPFSSRADYDALVQTLVATGTIQDGTHIYWDIRPSARFPTLEFRMADVCATVDEAIMVAGLVRGLARTCYGQAVRDEPGPAVRPELLRVAHFLAARDGLDGDLVDVEAGRAAPAADVVDRLLAFVRPGLEQGGDWDEVLSLVEGTRRRGTGAARQRAAYQRTGRLEDVVDLLVEETAAGVGP